MATGFKNSDYILATTLTDRIAKLKLFIKEVTDCVNDPHSQTIDGLSYSREQLYKMVKDLKEELKELESADGSNKMRNVTFLRPRLGRCM
jgi:hypothetical protein